MQEKVNVRNLLARYATLLAEQGADSEDAKALLAEYWWVKSKSGSFAELASLSLTLKKSLDKKRKEMD